MRLRCPEILPAGLVPARIIIRFSAEEQQEHSFKKPCILWAADMYRKFQRLPGILDDDCIVLLHGLVTLEAQKQFWPTGKRVTDQDMERCLDFASHVVLGVLWPDEPLPFETLAFNSAIEEWAPSIHLARQRAREGRGNERDWSIDWVITESWNRYGPKRDVSQFFNVAKSVAKETGVLEEGTPNEEKFLEVILMEYRNVTGGSRAMYRAENGMVRLGRSELRDYLCKKLAGKRPARKKRDTDGEGHEQPHADPITIQLPDDLDPVAQDGSVIQALEHAESIALVRAALAKRKRALKPGTLAARTLPHLLPLISGERTLDEVAAELGASKSGVHEAVAAHRKAMRAALSGLS